MPAPSPRPAGFMERLRSWLLDPEYPLTAIEVRPRSVAAVRASREGGRPVLAAAASLSLPEGALALSMVQPNLSSRQAFCDAVRGVIERAGIPPRGDVGLVLPDPVARVSLIPASELQGKSSSEIEDLVRFRLRKAVPFDVKDACVACQMPRTYTPESLATAVVIARPVLVAYEEALAEVGLQPGLVELAGLTMVGALEASRPPGDRLVVNWDEGYVSLVLTRAGDSVLVRTLTGEVAATHEDVIREVSNTVLYYREKLGGAGLDSVVLRSALLPPAEAVRLLREPLGMAPEIFDPFGQGDDSAAGQAVAAAAACVAGKLA